MYNESPGRRLCKPRACTQGCTDIGRAVFSYGNARYFVRRLSFILQYNTATRLLNKVAAIAGAMIPAGLGLPYWLR